MMDGPIALDFRREAAVTFPDVYDVCREATDLVLGILPEGNYDALTRHQPGLIGYDWHGYIDLSLIRMVRVARALRKLGKPNLEVLDFGSYFGNFALMARKLGCEVDALDSYARYSPALSRERDCLVTNGITIIDSSVHEDVLDRQDKQYDVILCLGVIEHIAHTPRLMLEYLVRHLRRGGRLILDTPNLAYLYRREALARGESVYPAIERQFETAAPFEGHHREYTLAEVEWMLRRAGLSIIERDMFNYSIYGNTQLLGEDARRFRDMEADPSKREVMFVVAGKRVEA